MSDTVLSVFNLSKSYGAYPVFEGITFSLNVGERAALVGPNGAGKSTLLKIIAGEEAPTGGSVVKARGVRVAYVPQEASVDRSGLPVSEGDSLLDWMLDACGPVRALQGRMRELEALMAGVDGHSAEWQRLMAEYEQVMHRFEGAGGYDLEHHVARVLVGLGFDEAQLAQPVAILSGGQRTRAALARALIASPDLLLLDEPTNHLDIAALEWLERFLLQWKGAMIVIAHDRRFLNRVTTRTLDMEFTGPRTITWYSKSGELRAGEELPPSSRLHDYPAPYDRYLELKAERYERMLAEYEAQHESIQRTWEFIRRYRAGQRARQASGRLKRLQRLHNENLLERPAERTPMRMVLRAHVRSGRSVLEAEDLVVGYPAGGPQTGELVLVRCPDLEVERGERVALIGPNGSGKTTFLRTIMGQLPPLAGRVELGHNVRFGYYSQTHEGLNADNSVIREILSARSMSEGAARGLLAGMLFTGDAVYKKVGELSGGERSRLALAKLTLTGANFLILDEPTNHLDLESQEVLTAVLADYDGTILFVSHDRAFIDDLATQVWSIEGGQLVVWQGTYNEYAAHRSGAGGGQSLQQDVARRGNAQSPAPRQGGGSGEDGRAARRRQRAVERERLNLQKRIEQAEAHISELEALLNATSDALSRATEARDLDEIVRLGIEYTRLEAELDRAYEQWQKLEEESAS